MKILLAENNTPLAMFMVASLTQAGHDVHTACTGVRAMVFLAKTKFDLIILESHLPDISGFEVYRNFKQRDFYDPAPVVFVSAYPTIEDQQHALDLGAADIIEIPFNKTEFLQRVLSSTDQSPGICQ